MYFFSSNFFFHPIILELKIFQIGIHYFFGAKNLKLTFFKSTWGDESGCKKPETLIFTTKYLDCNHIRNQICSQYLVTHYSRIVNFFTPTVSIYSWKNCILTGATRSFLWWKLIHALVGEFGMQMKQCSTYKEQKRKLKRKKKQWKSSKTMSTSRSTKHVNSSCSISLRSLWPV